MSESFQLDNRPAAAAGADDQGYMLLGLIVAIALLLLWLGVAATNVAFAIRREREVETARRADQYLRAIRLYYKKFGHYPGSVDQLEKSNNIRFLRRKWEDPLTKTTDWRLISVGQNKTTVKGFFGEPLAGLPGAGIGAPAGSQPAGTPGSPTAPGSPAAGASAGAGGLGAGMSILGSPPTGTAAPAGGAAAGAPGTTTGTGTAAAGTGGTNSQSGSSNSNGLGGTGGAIMGVGTNATGNSILVVNEQTDYQSWEFLYDPRLELLKQQQQLNQGVQSNGAGSFGQTPSGTSPTTPTGSQQPGAVPAPAPTVGTPVQQ
jgi:type II secretory pathway pseudopilin PulG